MKHFDFLKMKHFDFQDPYAVEGASRAKRFADNYNAQQLFGPSGFAKQCAIVREANRNLLPKHLQVFCTEIGHAPSSQTFKILLELGERYYWWEKTLGSAYSDLAMLNTIVDSPDAFEQTIDRAEHQMYMDADELREHIVPMFFVLNGKS